MVLPQYRGRVTFRVALVLSPLILLRARNGGGIGDQSRHGEAGQEGCGETQPFSALMIDSVDTLLNCKTHWPGAPSPAREMSSSWCSADPLLPSAKQAPEGEA